MTDLRAQMASAMMNAALDVCRGDDGTALVDPEQLRHALVMVTAMMLEADPLIRTPKEIREASEVVAREVRLQVAAMRRQFEKSGQRGWDARPIIVN